MDAGKLGARLAEIEERHAFVVEDFEAGFISEEDVFEEFKRLHGGGCPTCGEVLGELGLRGPVLSEGNAEDFALDYLKWERGEEPDSSGAEPWLYASKERRPATSEERAAFFEVRKALFVPTIEPEFPPTGMAVPERLTRVYGKGIMVIVGFECADDGGLLEAGDPRGETFELVGEDGLRAWIKVEERAGYEYRPARPKGSQFRGLISVEGYTASGLHSTGAVSVSSNGRISSVNYWNRHFVEGDDEHMGDICTPEELEAAEPGADVRTKQGERNEAAFLGFPRWRPYFEWRREHPDRLLSPSFEGHVDAYMRSRPDSWGA